MALPSVEAFEYFRCCKIFKYVGQLVRIERSGKVRTWQTLLLSIQHAKHFQHMRCSDKPTHNCPLRNAGHFIPDQQQIQQPGSPIAENSSAVLKRFVSLKDQGNTHRTCSSIAARICARRDSTSSRISRSRRKASRPHALPAEYCDCCVECDCRCWSWCSRSWCCC